MNTRLWLTITLTLSMLTAVTGLATAQQKVLVAAKVTQVNVQTKTFTVVAKGKRYTFNAARLKSLPKLGDIVDITYTGTGDGPLEAANLNLSKSNIN